MLEHSFQLTGETGQFIFDGYGGHADHIHVEINHATWELSQDDVTALHAYLSAWIRARQATALDEVYREMMGDPLTPEEAATMRAVLKKDSDKGG